MTTLNLQVGAGADDAYEQDNSFGFNGTSTSVWMSSDTASYARKNGASRFQNVLVGQADTIDAATAQVYIHSGNRNANIDIFAEDVDNAANFVDTADVTSRDRTGTSVAWVENSLTQNTYNTSPEIKTVIQELVNRGGWSSGNALVMLYDGKSDVNQSFGTTSFEHDATETLKLNITFSGGAPVPITSNRLLRGHGI